MAASVYESEMSRALDTRLVPSSPQVPDSAPLRDSLKVHALF